MPSNTRTRFHPRGLASIIAALVLTALACETPHQIEYPANAPPGAPSDPSPAVDTGDVPLDVELSWSGGEDPDDDAVMFDVFLGTGEPLARVSSTTESFLDLGGLPFRLATDDTVYWRVVARDTRGASNEGSMWYFRTAIDTNQWPTAIRDLVPADRDTGVAVDVVLRWQGGIDPDGGSVTYGAILDLNADFNSVAVQADSSLSTREFDPPRDLANSTTYYWRVTATDSAGGRRQSEVASFLTRSTGSSGENEPPYDLREPVPADGATDVTHTITQLRWAGGNDPDGDPVVYSVFFGDTASPPLVTTTTSKLYPIPGPLAQGMSYYWRVTAADDHDHVTVGALWSFTTGVNAPPEPVTDPIPPDGAEDVARDIELSWRGGDDPEGGMTTYDVYFAIEGAPLDLIRSTSHQNWPPAGTSNLRYATTYTWRIHARDPDSLVTMSPLWRFTTLANLPPSTPTYLSPDDGATGVPIEGTLVWNSVTDPEGDPILYDVYLGDIGGPPILVATVPDTTYTPPSGFAYSTTYRWIIVANDSEENPVAGAAWTFSTVEGFAPSAPCGPTIPADGATEIDLPLTLIWSCGVDPNGDPVTFTVRFDTVNPPVNVLASDLTAPSAVVPSLSVHTNYYWQVEASDGFEPPVQGPVWTFLTLDHPPWSIHDPTPLNGSINVDINANLAWQGGMDPDGDPVTFSVYVDTVNPPVALAGTSQSPTFDPGTLVYSTSYYWQVHADDGFGGVTTSPIWNFATGQRPNNPPSVPSSPSPAGGATGVARSTTLSWSGGIDPDGDPVTFDVYFGETDPPAFVGNQVAATYDPPGDLAYSTDYYWQIVAKDDRGAETSGPVWSFATGERPNTPPSEPSGPSPADGATDVSVAVTVSWSGGIDPDGDPVTFDVYFGETDPPAFVGNQVAATYDPPGDLAYSTDYYWRILAKDDRGGETPGSSWSFTTHAPPNSPPTAPSGASPSGGAIDVPVTTALAWSGGIDPDGDPVTFDVYLGTSNPPALIGNQAAATYDPPGNLDYTTLYFWRIVAKDNRGGETPGPVWNFTTEASPNTPPLAPDTPDPANGAVGVAIDTVLTWAGGTDPDGDPVTFDVYFGTTDPPGLIGNQPGAGYDPAGDLTPSTAYYWRIVAKDNQGGQTSGGTWTFVTAP